MYFSLSLNLSLFSSNGRIFVLGQTLIPHSLQLDRFRRMVTPKFPPDLALSHSPSGPILCIHSHMVMNLVLSSVLLCWFQDSSFVPGCEDTEGVRPWAGLQCGRTAAYARSNRRCLGGITTTPPLVEVIAFSRREIQPQICIFNIFYRYFVFPN